MPRFIGLLLLVSFSSLVRADSAADTPPLPPEEFMKVATDYDFTLSPADRQAMADFIDALPEPRSPDIAGLRETLAKTEARLRLPEIASILHSEGVQTVCERLQSHEDPVLRFVVCMPLIVAGNSEATATLHEIIHSDQPSPLQQQLIATWCAGMGIRAKTDTPEAIFEHMRAAASDEPKFKPGDTAPEFELVTTSGEALRLSDFKGRVLVLHFWATWCGPCMGEMDMLIHQLKDFPPESVAIISVSLDYDRETFEKAAAELQLPWHSAIDTAGWGADIARAFGVNHLPFHVVIDGDGKVVSCNVDDIPRAHSAPTSP